MEKYTVHTSVYYVNDEGDIYGQEETRFTYNGLQMAKEMYTNTVEMVANANDEKRVVLIWLEDPNYNSIAKFERKFGFEE